MFIEKCVAQEGRRLVRYDGCGNVKVLKVGVGMHCYCIGLLSQYYSNLLLYIFTVFSHSPGEYNKVVSSKILLSKNIVHLISLYMGYDVNKKQQNRPLTP